MTVIVALLALVVALLAVLVVGLLRTNAEVMRALDRLGAGLEDDGGAARRGLPRLPAEGVAAKTGRPAADLSGSTLDGGAHAVRVVGVEHDTLLVFLSSGCLTCRPFWDALRTPGALGLPDGVRVVAVAKDLAEESPTELAPLTRHLDIPVLLSTSAWEAYSVPGSPYAVLVDGPDGRVVGEGTGSSWEQIANFLAQATGDLAWVGEHTPRARKARRDAQVERDTDAELLAAGILPDDPSLYP